MSKVLIIDDDENMQALYQRVFSLENFETEVANGGAAGIEKAASFQPDIIFLDMMMPVINGLEVLTKLKENPTTKPIPVVVLSNYSEQDIQNRATELGAAYYLVKSDVDPTQVVTMARSILDKNSTPQSPPS